MYVEMSTFEMNSLLNIDNTLLILFDRLKVLTLIIKISVEFGSR